MNLYEKTSLDSDEVLQVLPHRYPFLMVDKVLSMTPTKVLNLMMSEDEVLSSRVGSKAKTLKNVSANENMFSGHFPGNPIFPGVMTLEFMAQSAVFVAAPFISVLNKGGLPPISVALLGIDEVRFRKVIKPGDQIIAIVEALQVRGGFWNFRAEVTLEGKVVAEAKIMAQLGGKI